MTTVDEVAAATDRRPNALVRLYRGETSFDFVGHRRWWYALSAIVIVAGLVSMGTRGFNWGIDFKGGTSWQVASHGASVTEVENAVKAAGVSGATVEVLGGRTVNVEADLTKLPAAQQATIKAAVATALGRIGHVPAPQVSVTDVGATWGSQISQKAIIAVLVFFIVVVVYITFRFEWKMAIAALLAVIHDLLVTAGIYSLAGFQVTPDTVIAVLTILGYSLYDTVVVFDRVGENTKGLGASGRMTYEDVVNLSMNQTLARSINTSLVAILPVLSVLVIGAQILGATTLQYFGLALVIGLTSGAYSSIFIASPVLASMKEREPRYINIRQKLANRSDRTGVLTPRAAAALTVASGPAVGARAVTGSRARGGRAAAGAARAAPTAQRPPGVLRPGAATRAAAEPEPAGP
ncbi:MAG TPA: protein translocase subunit SecF, partial [Acidimicrobiales bacterium]|nr:protein translocase subunit SecF [Acidimicrobiales bacterium]